MHHGAQGRLYFFEGFSGENTDKEGTTWEGRQRSGVLSPEATDGPMYLISIYNTYNSDGKPIQWAVAGPHGQRAV